MTEDMKRVKEFIDKFEKNLDKALQEKTSWGRNDLKLLIKATLTDTILEVSK